MGETPNTTRPINLMVVTSTPYTHSITQTTDMHIMPIVASCASSNSKVVHVAEGES